MEGRCETKRENTELIGLSSYNKAEVLADVHMNWNVMIGILRSILVIHSCGWRAAIIENSVSILNECPERDLISWDVWWAWRCSLAWGPEIGDCKFPEMKGPSLLQWLESSRVSSVREEGLKACGCWVVPRADKEVMVLHRRKRSEFHEKFFELFLDIEGRFPSIISSYDLAESFCPGLCG